MLELWVFAPRYPRANIKMRVLVVEGYFLALQVAKRIIGITEIFILISFKDCRIFDFPKMLTKLIALQKS